MAYQPGDSYNPTEWVDHITDPEVIDPATGKPIVLQDGTRVNAKRLNNIENGLLGSYEWLAKAARDIARHEVYLAIDGRASGNNGTFFDTIDDRDPYLLALENASGLLKNAVSAGVTVLQLDRVTGFKQWEQLTIADDENFEYVTVHAINATAKTVTVTKTTNAYKKGAVVARTTAVRDLVAGTIQRGQYKTYTVGMD